MTMAPRGIILFGHGSRDPLWRLPIEAVAARISNGSTSVTVRCAFLELDQPDLATAADEIIATGARSITIVPMFLGTGRHAREDLPRLVMALIDRHPAVAFVLQPPVGEDARVVELLARIALE
jgi:sirohydrochlorin cobaltochelatase